MKSKKENNNRYMKSITQKIPIRRAHPSRRSLRTAIRDARLVLLGEDVMFSDIKTGQVYYYDASVLINGKQGVIMVVPKNDRYVRTTKTTYRKREIAAYANDMEFTYIFREDHTWKIQYCLEVWKMTGESVVKPSWNKK